MLANVYAVKFTIHAILYSDCKHKLCVYLEKSKIRTISTLAKELPKKVQVIITPLYSKMSIAGN